MPWGYVAAAIGGALISSDATSSAAETQAGASREATAANAASSAAAVAEQRRQADRSWADYAPWREAGGPSVTSLARGLGFGDSTSPDFGQFNKKFTVADFMDDPITKLSYESGLNLGREAIDRMAGARGSRNSGATLKALFRFGTDYTGGKAGESYGRFYGDQERAFNLRAALSGIGQTAARDTATAGGASATNIGNILMNQGTTAGNIASSLGNARGAAAIAQGNIWGGAAQNIGNWYNQNQMLNRYLGGGGQTYSSGGSGGGVPDYYLANFAGYD